MMLRCVSIPVAVCALAALFEIQGSPTAAPADGPTAQSEAAARGADDAGTDSAPVPAASGEPASGPFAVPFPPDGTSPGADAPHLSSGSEPDVEAFRVTEVFVLQHSNPDTVARALKPLLRGRLYEMGTEPAGNRLIVHADPATAAAVREAVETLDGPPAGSDGAGAGGADEVRVIALKHAVAEELAPLLSRILARRAGEDLFADPRTNSLLVRGSRSDLESAVALVQILDQPDSRERPRRDVPATAAGLVGDPESVRTIRQQLADVERQAEEIARQRRALRDSGDSTAPRDIEGRVLEIDRRRGLVETSIGIDDGLKMGDELYVYRVEGEGGKYLGKIKIRRFQADRAVAAIMELRDSDTTFRKGDHISTRLEAADDRAVWLTEIPQLENRLRRAVTRAFELRQQLQRAELEALRRRLAVIERTIAARDAVRDEIISRRVEELSNPELRWE